MNSSGGMRTLHEHSAQPANEDGLDGCSDNATVISPMPWIAARYFDVLHIPQENIYSRTSNPWLGVAVSSGTWWMLLPFNVAVYGYLGNFHPVFFTASIVIVPIMFTETIYSLRSLPAQVTTCWFPMTLFVTELLVFMVHCLGSLVVSVLPGGRVVPGGSLLTFFALNIGGLLFIIYRVRFYPC